ncbi:Glycosyl transferases group 1 [Verrucomicrobium sp. GAS474]|uniref:glycosyltransferase family protein n=1 Tax=Verrucomicrobium sp. GAS474 TaxID=1882831 RepID=UPI00087C297D|nr:glycosyltransferase [Verrucomicrobium sp. GAS474]SDU00100.1 Glycosyl transferases group 1 [Verrucomicrobium sp. GAS474]
MNFLTLHPLLGMRHLALDEWNAALRAAGHEVEERALRRPDAPPEETAAALAAEIGRKDPAALFAASALLFTLPSFFERPEVAGRPLVCFWFDDPYRPVTRWEREPGFLDALRRPHVHHHVWDGHWRAWLAERHGIASRPIHLAADPDFYRPLPPEGRTVDDVVFIGTLASRAAIEARKAALSPVLAKAARQVEAALVAAPFGADPFALVEAALAGLPERLRAEVEALAVRTPDALLALRALAWHLGKNEVRRRMLRAALDAAPVTLFSGNLEQTQAGAGELAALVGPAPHPLHFHNTGNLPLRDLPLLYAEGRLHLQGTDPQSVLGGLPFRVFQTTACGQALLTDVKPELLACYREGTEIACYRTEAEIAPAIARWLTHAPERQALAAAGRERFLAEHTWAHRVREVLGGLGLTRAA